MALEVDDVLSYLNNYFTKEGIVNVSVDFDASTKTIEFNETDNLDDYVIPNQYVWIQDSILNDGVYKVESVYTNAIVVTETIQDEEDSYITFYALAIPKALLGLIAEMQAYEELNPSGSDNIKSETLGPHSITYDKTTGLGGVFGNFASRLKRWKRIGWQ